MKGRRLPDGEVRFGLGDYGRIRGEWYACTPSGDLASLAGHEVTEHEDGTISVAPSILVSEAGYDKRELWHGWLRRGEWVAA